MKRISLLAVLMLLVVFGLTSCISIVPATGTTAPDVSSQFTVTFAGAQGIAPQTVEENGFAAEPTTPEKEGFTFLGWYDEEDTPFDFEETAITRDITLTAKWEAITFDVTFYDQNGQVLTVSTVNSGDAARRPNLSLADNQEFRGWFTEPDGQGEAFALGTPVYENTSYYAYVVTGAFVRFNGEDGNPLIVYFLEEGQTAVAPNAPDKSGVGKEFVGWFDANGNKFDPAATYTANVAFTAKYSQNTVVVKFMSAGKLLSEVRLEKGEAVARPEDPTRDGYIFGGWQLNGEDYDFTQPVQDSITLTAVWTEEPVIPPTPEYTVSFAGEGVNIPTQTVVSGQAAEKPADPTREGFVFVGWLLNGEEYNFASPVSGDITLTASWTAEVISDHTVTFVDGEGNTIATETVSHGGNVTLPTSATHYYACDFAKLFNIKADATILLTPVAKDTYAEKDYFFSESFVNEDPRIAFDGFNISWGAYLWQVGQSLSFTEEMAGQLKLKFYTPASNGVSKFTEGQSATIEVSVDGIAIKTFVITKDTARQFYSCYDNLPAGVHTVTVKLIELVNITPDKYGSTVGLADILVQEKIQTFTVNFAGEGVNIPAQTVVSGQAAEKPADPTREGFVFAGWLLDGEAYDFSAPVEGNITLTAAWTAEVISDHTVTFVDGEGNTIATETVPHGGNATIPTSATHYYACDFTKLFDIKADAMILLTPVAKDAYAERDYFLSMDFVNADQRIEFDGFLVAWGTYLYNVGQSFSYTDEMAGKLALKLFIPTNNDGTPKFQDGQSYTINVSVDGILMKTFVIDSGTVRQFYTICDNLPAGRHTVTVTVVAMEGISVDKYGPSVGLADILVQEKIQEFTVSFAGEGVNIPAQTVIGGTAATKPENPTREGFVFAGWLLNGEIYSFASLVTADITLTASWEEEVILPTTEHTVTFVDNEGNTIATQTVPDGENATLPSSADYFYEFSPVDALYNINENKTIVLTPVAKTGYTTDVEYSTMSTTGAYDHEGMSTTGGALKNYATLLFRVDQEFSFTANMAGLLKIKFAQFNVAEGQSISIDILVDGVVVNQMVIESDFVRAYYDAAYIPTAGEHTVTVRVTEMAGVASPNYNWGTALGVCNVTVNEASE